MVPFLDYGFSGAASDARFASLPRACSGSFGRVRDVAADPGRCFTLVPHLPPSGGAAPQHLKPLLSQDTFLSCLSF